MIRVIRVVGLCLLISTGARAEGLCDSPARNPEMCREMQHLHAQIHTLDSQRELMRVNPNFLAAIGQTLAKTAQSLLDRVGPSAPEVVRGLNGLWKNGNELTQLAEKRDPKMMVVANLARLNCAYCHQSHASGDRPPISDVFMEEWTEISARCSLEGKNPYLCKSMNGMLSSYGYLKTAAAAKLGDFEMTAQAANEIARILEDLHANNFTHLPEDLRLGTLGAAREVTRLARAHDARAFEQGASLMNACLKCHDTQFGPVDPPQGKASTRAALSGWLSDHEEARSR